MLQTRIRRGQMHPAGSKSRAALLKSPPSECCAAAVAPERLMPGICPLFAQVNATQRIANRPASTAKDRAFGSVRLGRLHGQREVSFSPSYNGPSLFTTPIALFCLVRIHLLCFYATLRKCLP